MKDNFLLNTQTAIDLYENFAKKAPIYDYHCHLSAKDIYEDKLFQNITDIWLKFDHYKWRALRIAGVEEKYITGDANDREKFMAWSNVVGNLLGSPLYHWTMLELKQYFGIDEFLNPKSAERIYEYCNKYIIENKLTPVKMILRSNVSLICTTDDPVDDLYYHKKLKEKSHEFKVLPTFRPDNVFNLQSANYREYIQQLADVSKVPISSYDGLKKAILNRIEYFDSVGCVLSDHSLESLTITEQDDVLVDQILKKSLSGKVISFEENEKFKNQTLKFLAKTYSEKKWVMQMHIGALRNVNKSKLQEVGPNSGFDIMNDFSIAEALSVLMNEINEDGSLPKSIIYTLNEKDNLVLSSIPHCFSEENVPGKIQFGAPWWFNDHKEGFINHFKALGNQSMFANFVGMLTDSRSFLSYVRHDYFRRILCDYIGGLVEKGEFDNNLDLLGEIVEAISFRNIKKYLGI